MGPVVKVGESGEVVAYIQKKLVELGYKLGVDGIFGLATENAVKQFQDKNGLLVDGIVGPRTVEKMFPKQAKPVYTAPVRGKVKDLTLTEVLERANGCIGAPITYHLEYPNGGTDPDANAPCDEQTGYLDCSGFTSWCEGYDRYQPGKFKYWDGYLNTDSKIAEAEAEAKWFTPLAAPEVGCLLVGETFRRLTGQRVIGHESVVVNTDHWNDQGLAGIAVVHCSPSNVKKNPQGSAIWKTNGVIWSIYKKYRFVRFNRAYALGLI